MLHLRVHIPTQSPALLTQPLADATPQTVESPQEWEAANAKAELARLKQRLRTSTSPRARAIVAQFNAPRESQAESLQPASQLSPCQDLSRARLPAVPRPTVHPNSEPNLSLGPSPHQQHEEANRLARPGTPEEYLQETAAPSFGLIEAERPVVIAHAHQEVRPVFGEGEEEAASRPATASRQLPSGVEIVPVERDDWESKSSSIASNEEITEPIPAPAEGPPPPPLEAQPAGYARDGIQPPPEDPEAPTTPVVTGITDQAQPQAPRPELLPQQSPGAEDVAPGPTLALAISPPSAK